MLGPVELLSGGNDYKLGARKERGVLAVLLWELGHPVPAETLVSRIWGDDASSTRVRVALPERVPAADERCARRRDGHGNCRTGRAPISLT